MSLHTFLLQFAFLYAPLIHGTVEQVSPTLWRGPDPKIQDIYKLHDQGFKTIISLRTNPEYKKQELCNKLGMYWVQIPTGVFLTPTTQELDEFRMVANNPKMQPCYATCEVNMDRTGVYLAAYHRCDQNWTRKQVKDEFVKYHQKVWWPVFRKYEGVVNAYSVRQDHLNGHATEDTAAEQMETPLNPKL